MKRNTNDIQTCVSWEIDFFQSDSLFVGNDIDVSLHLCLPKRENMQFLFLKY